MAEIRARERRRNSLKPTFCWERGRVVQGTPSVPAGVLHCRRTHVAVRHDSRAGASHIPRRACDPAQPTTAHMLSHSAFTTLTYHGRRPRFRWRRHPLEAGISSTAQGVVRGRRRRSAGQSGQREECCNVAGVLGMREGRAGGREHAARKARSGARSGFRQPNACICAALDREMDR